MRGTTTLRSALSALLYSAGMPLACVAWPAMSHAVSPVIAINDEAKTVTVKPQAVRGGLFVLEGSGGNAKWGGFVLDGAFFTRIVYDGLK